MSETFDPYYSWLGIPPEEQPPNHYRLLGIKLFEENAEVISNAADQRMVFLRTFQAGKHGALSQWLLNEVSTAQVCLLNPEKKAAYDAELRGQLTPDDGEEAPSLVSGLEDVIAESRAQRRPSQRRVRSWLPAVVGSIVAVGVVGVVLWALHRQGMFDTTIAPPEKKEDVSKEREPPAPKAAARPVQASPSSLERPKGEVAAASSAATVGGGSGSGTLAMAGKEPSKQSPAAPGSANSPSSTGASKPAGKWARKTAAEKAKWFAPKKELQGKIEEELEMVFQISLATTPPEKLQMAHKLLDASTLFKSDPPKLYVALRTASRLANQGEDLSLAVRISRMMGDSFRYYDSVTWGSRMITNLLARASDPAQVKSAVTAYEQVLGDAVAAGRIDDALSLATTVEKACESAAGEPYRKDVAARCEQLKKLQAAFAKLHDQPDDAAANGQFAAWFCFEQGDWARGLPYVVKASDAQAAALAAREMQCDRGNTAERLAIADAWWDWGQQHPSVMIKVRQHAAACYQELLAGSSGMEKARLEKRLGEADPNAVNAVLASGVATNFGCPPTYGARGKPLEVHTKFATWRAPGASVDLLGADAGLCLLTELSGSFVAPGDTVALKVSPKSYWNLSGQVKKGSLGGTAAGVTLPEGVLVQTQAVVWHQKDGPLKLLSAEEGICVLAGLKGRFDQADDRVDITRDADENWHITGKAHQGSFDVTVLKVRFAMPDSIQWDVAEVNWSSPAVPKRILREREGFCALTGLSGGLRDSADDLGLFVGSDKYWCLRGRASKRPVTTRAISVRFFAK